MEMGETRLLPYIEMVFAQIAEIKMSLFFEPIKERKIYLSFNLDYLKKVVFENGVPMGNLAAADIRDVFYAYIVGFDQEVRWLLPSRLEWLDKGIKTQEIFGPSLSFHMYTLHKARAQYIWLQDGVLSEEDWCEAVRWYGTRLLDPKDPIAPKYIISDELEHYMHASYLAADESEGVDDYEAAIEFYERYCGAVPPNINKTLKPREYIYALCLAAARGTFSGEALHIAGKKMLTKNMNEWLRHGGSADAAQWLYIVYGHNNPWQTTITPLQCLLKAYDHMPHITELPDFIAAIKQP